MKNKKFTHYYFICDELSICHRQQYLYSMNPLFNEWSELVIIQPPVSLFIHTITQFKKKIIGLFKGDYKTSRLEKGAYVFTPVILFHYLFWLKFDLLAKIDVFLITHQLKKFSRKYNLPNNNNILWMFYPHQYELSKSRFFHKCIYDYYDNFSFSEDGKKVEYLEKANIKLLKKSDLVFCTSKYLLNIAKEYNINSYLINNGCSFELLKRIDTPVRIEELDKIRKPIIGYVGILRDWIDIDLLEFVMKSLENVTFFFIGMVEKKFNDDFNRIKSFENFKMIDFQPTSELRKYMTYFDAAIIPFKINNFMLGVYPNKFNEYLAAEIPTITTALPDLKDYSGIIGYSENKEEFLDNCIKAINGGFTEKVKQYASIAKNNSWDMKARELDTLLKKYLFNE